VSYEARYVTSCAFCFLANGRERKVTCEIAASGIWRRLKRTVSHLNIVRFTSWLASHPLSGDSVVTVTLMWAALDRGAACWSYGGASLRPHRRRRCCFSKDANPPCQ
jgi:hypothetical protein